MTEPTHLLALRALADPVKLAIGGEFDRDALARIAGSLLAERSA